MIKLKELLSEPVPDVLYHATFNPLVPYIQDGGLVPGGKLFKNFEDIEDGVYLSNDLHFAGDMVNASENKKIPEKWFGEIVVIVIDTKKLDKNKFDKDPNVDFGSSYGETSQRSYIYRGTIPPAAIKGIYDYEG